MKTLAIIVEYNPFHNGHYYQIQEAKRQTDADYIIAIMSGDFTQRGEVAIFNKFTRCQMALHCGVDLVLELPIHFSVSSAEFFAHSAIAHLNYLNSVDYLCFGSESGDLELLKTIAHILVDEPKDFKTLLKVALKAGHSFPKARTIALLDYLTTHQPELKITEELLKSPNNILAIEYLKALIKTSSLIKPLTIKRLGAGYHDLTDHSIYCSASFIRQTILKKQPLDIIFDQIPEAIHHLINQPPLCNDDFSLALGMQLISQQSFNQFMDISVDLAKRLQNSCHDFISFSQFSDLLANRSHTQTRVNRCLMHILLNITNESMNHYKDLDYCAYIRVLGFKKTAAPLLKLIKAKHQKPLIYSLTDDTKVLDQTSFRLLETTLQASELYRLVFQNKFQTRIKNEYQQGLILS